MAIVMAIIEADTPMNDTMSRMNCQSGVSSGDKVQLDDANPACEHLAAGLIQNGIEKPTQPTIASRTRKNHLKGQTHNQTLKDRDYSACAPACLAKAQYI